MAGSAILGQRLSAQCFGEEASVWGEQGAECERLGGCESEVTVRERCNWIKQYFCLVSGRISIMISVVVILVDIATTDTRRFTVEHIPKEFRIPSIL